MREPKAMSAGDEAAWAPRRNSALGRLWRLVERKLEHGSGGDPSPEALALARRASAAAMSSWAIERGEERTSGFGEWAFDLDGALAWRQARVDKGLPIPPAFERHLESLPGWMEGWKPSLSTREHHGFACLMALGGGGERRRMAERLCELDAGIRARLAKAGARFWEWPQSEERAAEGLAVIDALLERRELEESAAPSAGSSSRGWI